VRAAAPANRLSFPLNLRLVMFAWNFLSLERGPYRPDAAHDAIWNRGAYLAEGLGHCGACHTPRNAFGAEKTGERFGGGETAGWTAYALDSSSPAPVTWTAAALERYLHEGFAPDHGAASGPMAEVVRPLRAVPQSDVRAIATYVAAQMSHGVPSPMAPNNVEAQARRGNAPAPQSADSQADVSAMTLPPQDGWEGARLYAAACGGCHEGPRAMPNGGIDLSLSSALSGPSAQNLLNIVLRGLPAVEGGRSPIMPGFAASLDDRQILELATYLRAQFSNIGPWQDTDAVLRAARKSQRAGAARRAFGSTAASFGKQRAGYHETQR
jgi:mono/diheme cytochrome c family protein